MSLRPRALVAATLAITCGALLAPPAGAAPSGPEASAGPVASATTAYTPGAPRWGACTTQRLKDAKARCAMIKVPLDYAKPDGTKITIALSRVRHTASRYQGVMLVNPGGPGGSGLGLATLGADVPHGVGKSYDWIGFDPRGVGASKPAITCDPDYVGDDRPRYVPSSPAVSSAWLSRSNAYTAACAKKNGPILDHMTTRDTVEDMESIRRALGATKINYYGFSYGTYLGQVYATLHPDRLRRVVFDGTVDPRGVWYRANLDQDRAFDANLDTWFGWVAKHDAVYHLGTTTRAVRLRFYRTQEKLYAAPAKTDAGTIGGSEWNDAFLGAGYFVVDWAVLAEAFSTYVRHGDIGKVADAYGVDTGDPAADNGYAAYLAVQCTDVSWPRSRTTWQRDAWRTYASAPYETWGNTWYNEPCRHWPGRVRTPVPVDGSKVAGLLMVNETRDAATPYAGSLEVRQRFPNARLIEGVGGTTHAGSLSGVACVDDRIAAYLGSGHLPSRKAGRRSDVRCSPVPPPKATTADARRQRSAASPQRDLGLPNAQGA